MQTLGLAPDSLGYTVDAGPSAIATVLDGGMPRIRADQDNVVSTVTCQWTLNPAQFDYIMAFYRRGCANGTQPFNISLIGIDSAEAATYTANIVPGSWKPVRSQSGLAYVVYAQLWAMPLNNTANDAAILAAGAPA